jgi:hypothetical protein
MLTRNTKTRGFYRILAIALTAAMIVGLFPAGVFADLPPTSEIQIVKDTAGTDTNKIDYFNVTALPNGTPVVDQTKDPDDDGDTTDGKYWNKSNQVTPDASKVQVSKSIKETNNENEFEITLDVLTKEDYVTSTTAKNAAVVLVIDISGSMGDVSNSSSRLNAAFNAAQNFVKSYAQGTGARWLQIVWFDHNAERQLGTWMNVAEISQDEIPNLPGLNPHNIPSATPPEYPEGPRNWRMGTNTEAGLQLAYNLYQNNDFTSKNVPSENSYTILLTDGQATCVIAQDGYEADYNPGGDTDAGSLYSYPKKTKVPANNSGSDTRIYGYTEKQWAATWSQDSSDPYITNSNVAAAYRVYRPSANNTDRIAEKLKSVSTLYSIGFHTNTARIDKSGNTINKTSVNDWLQALSDDILEADSSSTLANAFKELEKRILLRTEVWKVTDPMGEYIEFLGSKNDDPVSNSDENNVLYFNNDNKTLYWDLSQIDSGKEADTPTKRTYSYTYKVRLLTLKDGFEAGTGYLTNGPTTLTYAFPYKEESGKIIGFADENGNRIDENNARQTINFYVPKVRGRVGGFDFTKIQEGKTGNPLSGATFSLVSSETDADGKPYYKDVKISSSVAGEVGKVEFSGIPSGHSYTLTETKPPTGYAAGSNVYGFKVAYGEIIPDASVADGAKKLPDVDNINSKRYIENTPLPPEVELTKEVYSINDFEIDRIPVEDKQFDGVPYVKAGDTVVYKVTVKNTGKVAASINEIKDPLEGAKGPFASLLDLDDENIFAEFPVTLAAGTGKEVYYFLYTVPDNLLELTDESGVIQNTATADIAELGEDEDPKDSAFVAPRAPDIEIRKELISKSDKTIEGTTIPLFPHDSTVIFEVTIENKGNADTEEGAFTDIIAGGLNNSNAFDLDNAEILGVTYNGAPIAESVDLEELIIGAGEKYAIQYAFKLPGQTRADYEKTIADLTEEIQTEAYLLQVLIDNAQLAMLEQEALISLLRSRDPLGAKDWFDSVPKALMAEEGAPDSYTKLAEDIILKAQTAAYEAAAGGNPEDYETVLQEKLQALRNAVLEKQNEELKDRQEYYAALADETSGDGFKARAALVAAQNKLAKYTEQGNPFEIYTYKNVASYGGVSDEVTVAVDFDRESVLTVEKQVRPARSTSWDDTVRISEGENVEFRILVRNTGNAATSGPAILSDTFEDMTLFDVSIPEIPAGGTVTVLIEPDGYTIEPDAGSIGKVSLAGNYSDLLSNDGTFINTAKLTYEYGGEKVEETDTANVIVPPKKVPVLSIEKLVRIANSGGDFQKTVAVDSLEPVSFEFQITVWNTGGAPATGVAVRDYLNSTGDALPFTPVSGDFGGNIPAGEKAVFTASLTLAPGNAEINRASVAAEDAIIIKDSDWASAKVNDVSHSAMKVEKYVAQGSDWVKDAVFYSADPVDVLFKIEVTNISDVPGRFSLDDLLTADGGSGESITLEMLSLDPSGNTPATEANLTVSGGGKNVFYYTAKNVNPGSSLTNEVWITGGRQLNPDTFDTYDTVIEGGEAEASARVVNNPVLTLEKYVIAGNYDAGSDTADLNWAKSGAIEVPAGATAGVTYKIVLTAQGFARNLAASDGVDVTLTDVLDGSDTIEIVPGNTLRVSQDGTQVFYVQRALGAGSHSNVVTATANDDALGFTVDDENAASSAAYTVTNPEVLQRGGGSGGGITPAVPPIELEEEEVPLAEVLPESIPEAIPEDVYIFDEETPLADLPQTGATLPGGGQGPAQQGSANAAGAAVLPAANRRGMSNAGAVV